MSKANSIWQISHSAFTQHMAEVSLYSRPEMRDAKTRSEINAYLDGDGPWHQMDIDENGVAQLDMVGVCMTSVPAIYRFYGVEAVDLREMTAHVLSAIDNPMVKSLNITMDTPGGQVGGAAELRAALVSMSETKGLTINIPAGGDCCSLGMYLASAGRIYASESASVGCIGTVIVIHDMSEIYADAGVKTYVITNSESKVKGMLADGKPVTDDELAFLQGIVTIANDQFINALMSGRGYTEDEARALATGEYWFAPQALKRGLVDAVSNTPQTTTNQAIRKNTMLNEIKQLVDQHRSYAADIIEMAANGQSVEAIASAIKGKIAAEKEEQIKAEAEAKDAELVAMKAELEAIRVEHQAAMAKIAEMEKVTALAETQDPGNAVDDGDEVVEISTEDFSKLSAAERFEYLQQRAK